MSEAGPEACWAVAGFWCPAWLPLFLPPERPAHGHNWSVVQPGGIAAALPAGGAPSPALSCLPLPSCLCSRVAGHCLRRAAQGHCGRHRGGGHCARPLRNHRRGPAVCGGGECISQCHCRFLFACCQCEPFACGGGESVALAPNLRRRTVGPAEGPLSARGAHWPVRCHASSGLPLSRSSSSLPTHPPLPPSSQVDSASTPEQLGRLLDDVKEAGAKRVLLVFGCPGSTSKEHRAAMMRVGGWVGGRVDAGGVVPAQRFNMLPCG